MHLLRNSFRYAGRQHWDAIAKAFKPVYTAQTEAAQLDTNSNAWSGSRTRTDNRRGCSTWPHVAPVAGQPSDAFRA
ncbi:hypothetical protein Lesp02_02240 [Lentzea sp. NBRC 105346]|nr:hypothetical protein Lesp02_02240 [Lentzea sp. NBRC 105346]